MPQQRLTPLKTAWLSLYQPVTEQLHLDMRMNLKSRKVDHTLPAHTPAESIQAWIWFLLTSAFWSLLPLRSLQIK